MYQCSECGATDPKKHMVSCPNSSYSRGLRGELPEETKPEPIKDYIKVGGMVKAMQFVADVETGEDNARELAEWLPDATIFWEYEVKTDAMGVRIRYNPEKESAFPSGQMMPGDWMVYDPAIVHKGYSGGPWRLYTDEQFHQEFIPYLNGSLEVNLALGITLNTEEDYIVHNGQKYKLVSD